MPAGVGANPPQLYSFVRPAWQRGICLSELLGTHNTVPPALALHAAQHNKQKTTIAEVTAVFPPPCPRKRFLQNDVPNLSSKHVAPRIAPRPNASFLCDVDSSVRVASLKAMHSRHCHENTQKSEAI